jgi:phage terminase large subunit-like protein
VTPLEVLAATAAEARRRGLIKNEPEWAVLEYEAARRGLNTYSTLADYVRVMNPTLLLFEHVPKLVEVGERVVSGDLKNVLVMLPPRYFKTEVFGKLLTSYYLLRHPNKYVGLTSYGAELAWDTSLGAQRFYQRANGRMQESVQAKRLWETDKGGRMWALGMGAGITGRGYHLGVVDDPIKPEDVRSVVYQRRFAHWWPDTWLSRAEPGAQLVFVMQRLGPEDPIDLLFRREVGEKTELAPMHWHVMVMDEIKSEEPLGRWNGPKGLPPTCTLEPDTRPVGSVLSARRFTPEMVKDNQRRAGPLTTSAQRQQRPMQPTGEFWKVAWFQGREYETLPKEAYDGGRDWDTAMTREEANSATAWVLSFRGPKKPMEPGQPEEFDIYIEDVGWEWLEFPEMVRLMKQLAGPHYVEAKSSGKSAVQQLKAFGIRAGEVAVLGDKLARASAVQMAVSSGRVWVNAKVSQKLLLGERMGLLRVTAEGLQVGGEGLDLNDAFVQALFRHLKIGVKVKTIAFR